MSTSFKESGEKAKQGFVSINNRYFGKSTYVKNLIKQIQDLKNKSIPLENEIKPNMLNLDSVIKKKLKSIKKYANKNKKNLKNYRI